MQILNGFTALHTLRVMHRGFSPPNVLLKNDGSLVIANFGFCRLGIGETTTDGIGPLSYMAPEVSPTKGKTSYTNKVDLWSIGVTLYEMIFGIKLYPIDPTKEKPEQVKEWETETGRHNGTNLRFPKEGISEDLKDLLKRLLQY